MALTVERHSGTLRCLRPLPCRCTQAARSSNYHITDLDPDDLGHARARVVKHQEEHMVTLTDPCSIRRVDHGQHLLAGQVAEHRPLEALHGYAERTLDDLQRRHIPVGQQT
jgi:hypothetical protein